MVSLSDGGVCLGSAIWSCGGAMGFDKVLDCLMTYCVSMLLVVFSVRNIISSMKRQLGIVLVPNRYQLVEERGEFTATLINRPMVQLPHNCMAVALERTSNDVTVAIAA